MKKIVLIIVVIFFSSCNKKEKVAIIKPEIIVKSNDSRISLKLNEMQKQHQLSNMRSHLEAVQTLIT